MLAVKSRSAGDEVRAELRQLIDQVHFIPLEGLGRLGAGAGFGRYLAPIISFMA